MDNLINICIILNDTNHHMNMIDIPRLNETVILYMSDSDIKPPTEIKVRVDEVEWTACHHWCKDRWPEITIRVSEC